MTKYALQHLAGELTHPYAEGRKQLAFIREAKEPTLPWPREDQPLESRTPQYSVEVIQGVDRLSLICYMTPTTSLNQMKNHLRIPGTIH